MSNAELLRSGKIWNYIFILSSYIFFIGRGSFTLYFSIGYYLLISISLLRELVITINVKIHKLPLMKIMILRMMIWIIFIVRIISLFEGNQLFPLSINFTLIFGVLVILGIFSSRKANEEWGIGYGIASNILDFNRLHAPPVEIWIDVIQKDGGYILKYKFENDIELIKTIITKRDADDQFNPLMSLPQQKRLKGIKILTDPSRIKFTP